MDRNIIFIVINFMVSLLSREALCQTCDPSWLLYSDVCFKCFEGNVSYSATREQCALNGARLLSAFTPRLKDFLLSHDDHHENSSYWCNTLTGRIDESVLQTAAALPHTTASSATEIASKKDSHEEKCYYIQNKELHKGNCDELRGFICEKDSIPPPGTCPPGTDKIGTSCFWKVLELHDRREAEDICSTTGGWLANLDSRRKRIYGIAGVVLKRRNFWVGGRKEGETVKWGNGKVLDLEEDKNFLPTLNGSGQCVGLGLSSVSESGAAWIIGDCNIKAYALCEVKVIITSVPANISTTTPYVQTTPAPPKCPGSGAQNRERSGTCFWETTYETPRFDWDTSRQFCQSYGGDLACYKSAKEEEFALGDAKGHRGGIWIGLRREPHSNVFRWTDGSSLNYTNWAPGEPKMGGRTKLCVAHTGQNSTWEVAYCGIHRWFLCEIPKASIPVSPIPPTEATIPECSKRKTSPVITWRFYQDYCYAYYLSQKFSWEPANTFCQDNGAFLASIHSIEELNMLLRLAPRHHEGLDFWIGLRAKGLHSSYQWDDGTPLDFVNWDEDDSYDDAGNLDTCVSYNSLDGFWRKNHCNNLFYVICKAKNDSDHKFTTAAPTPGLPGFCPDGWYTFGNKCYRNSEPEDKVSWSVAKTKCEAIGSTLISIHSRDEQDFVTLLMLNLHSDVWIGMYSTIGGRLFHWTDNSSMDFANWNENEPNYDYNEEECVNIIFNEKSLGKWNDHRCKMRFPYICQIPKDPMLTKPGQDPFLCTGREGWMRLESSCYKIFNETDNRLTWLQAQSFCMSVGGTLASVKNFGMSLLLRSKLSGMRGPFWIGIRGTKNHKYAWLGASSLSYSNWLPGQPQDVSPLHNCVVMNTEGRWMVRDCDESHPFICEERKETPTVAPDEPDLMCPSASKKWDDFGGKFCYLIETKTTVKWYEATHICFKQGGYLASFHSPEENKAILHHIKDTGMPLHIGFGQKDDGSFGWFDGSAVDYVNWAPGEPNDPEEMCVEMHTDIGTWNDVRCKEERGFVCSTMKVARNKSTAYAMEDTSEGLQKRVAAGGIVGIIVCILVVVAIAAITCYYFCPSTRMRARRSEPSSP